MLSFIFFCFGAMIGSFLNVCIYRLPRSESISFPPSHCPACNTQLHFLDLIPLFSYLLLKGKCRYCHAGISPRYLLVEGLSGLFLAVFAYFSSPLINPLGFLYKALFFYLLLVVFFIDLEKQVIPDVLSASIGLLGIAGALVRAWGTSMLFLGPVLALWGGIIGFAVLYAIGKLGGWCFKKEAMGEGDYWLAAALGVFLGWEGVLVAIFLAYLMAGMLAIALLLVRKVKMGQYIPFGPALALGGILSLFFGHAILGWYLQLFTCIG